MDKEHGERLVRIEVKIDGFIKRLDEHIEDDEKFQLKIEAGVKSLQLTRAFATGTLAVLAAIGGFFTRDWF